MDASRNAPRSPALEASPLPLSLLSRLASDSTLATESIISSPLPEATQTVRATTDRRLLHLTGKALTTVDSLLECSDPKVRLAAASKILDTSPVTKPAALAPQESAIPITALRPLFEGIARLFTNVTPSPALYPTYEDLPYEVLPTEE